MYANWYTNSKCEQKLRHFPCHGNISEINLYSDNEKSTSSCLNAFSYHILTWFTPFSHDLWWENGFTPYQYHTSVQYRYSLKNLLSSDIFIRLHIFFSSTEYAWLKSDTLLQSLMYRERANGSVQLIVKINCSIHYEQIKNLNALPYTLDLLSLITVCLVSRLANLLLSNVSIPSYHIFPSITWLCEIFWETHIPPLVWNHIHEHSCYLNSPADHPQRILHMNTSLNTFQPNNSSLCPI